MSMTKEKAENKYLLVLAGPTASGKTVTAIKLAQHFKTEIISADSRQFYREMRIGTAVPSEAELAAAPHHFIRHRSIAQAYDVAAYENDVLTLLNEKFQTNRILILTGGSGLFIDAVCLGLDNMPETSAGVRQKVNDIYQTEGLEGLREQLRKVDPTYYKNVDKMNPRRMQRALEVYYQSGHPVSFFRKRQVQARDFEVIRLALQTDRLQLINNINLRVERMLAQGLLSEAKALYSHRSHNALNTVGYKELFAYFDKQLSLEEAVEQIKINTRRYAKRQMTWLRKNKDYQWFKPDELSDMIRYVEGVLDGSAR